MQKNVKTNAQMKQNSMKVEKNMTKEGIADTSKTNVSNSGKKGGCGCNKKDGSCDIKTTKNCGR